MWKNEASGKHIGLAWIPGHSGVPGNDAAGKMVAMTTTPGSEVVTLPWYMGRFKSVVIGRIQQTQQSERFITLWTTARHLKLLDSALPGKHVRLLYDSLTRTEAHILAQLRTGHSKLRSFLAKIKAEDTDQCECGQGKEDTRHFLFHCQRYQHLRGDTIREARERYGDLSYMLGGRSSHHNVHGSSLDEPIEKWKPNLIVVRTVIKYALQTGRLGPQTQLPTLA
jgi:hypothetical protein